MSESFAELFEQSQIQNKMRRGSIVRAEVLEINQDIVTVDAGLKSEGLIPLEQFLNNQGDLEVSVGDIVEVSLDDVEDGFGESKFSREKAKYLMTWAALEKAYETKETVTGVITDKVKGGFTVDIDKVKAFLPGSLIDVYPVKDTRSLEGRPLEFKVIKIDQSRNNVVVSRRAVMKMEHTEGIAELLSSLEEGAVVKGVVKNTTDYGAFLDLGGIDGLLHITDMAWKRVKNPSDIVSVGDEIEVRVLKFERDRQRVSLGLKQMGEDPWVALDQRYPAGMRLHGKVTNLADYGCFVELEEGVEGLVHVSEMDWTKKNIHPSKLAQVGQTVEVMVLDIDTEKRRISLSMKQCQPNPWEGFAAKHSKGDRVTGVIKSITDFGIFIELEGGIDGLIHFSDVTWSGNNEELMRQHNKGEKLETMVLSIDTERERISLGMKQMEKDPFATYIAEHPKGSVVTGTVEKIEANGVTLSLADNVEGYMKAIDLSVNKKVEDARTATKVGDTIEAKIIAVNRKKRSINVSVKAHQIDEEATAVKEYGKPEPDDARKGTLGDLLREKLGIGQK